MPEESHSLCDLSLVAQDDETIQSIDNQKQLQGKIDSLRETSCPPLVGGPKSMISRRGKINCHVEENVNLSLNNFVEDIPLTCTPKVRFSSLRTASSPARGEEFLDANSNNSRKVAFTLAEVLITLGIIGVVAALTLPSVINNYKERVTISKLKKLNSTFQNSFNLMCQEEFGGLDASQWGYISRDEFVQKYTKYMNVSKICTAKNINECFYKTRYSNLTGRENVLYLDELSGFILNDGATVALSWFVESAPQHVSITGNYGQIFVDVNGKNPPNVLGRDVFSFVILRDKVVPRGTINLKDDGAYRYDAGYSCTKSNASLAHNGLGCTAWVIYQENFEYLK